jgi:glycosyltransferase involved in cell wall biosynthesis
MIFLYVCKRDWKHPGPIVNFVTHNAHSVAARGYETHLVLGRGEPSDTEADLTDFYGLPPLENLHVRRVERRRMIGKSTSSLPVFIRACRVARALARRDRVAIITREAAFLPYLAVLRRLGGGRIAGYYEAHDLYADLSWRPKKPRVQDRRQQWIERLALPRIDGLVCITGEQRELYGKIFPDLRSCALPLGTRPQPPSMDPESRRKLRTAVYLGHLSAKKGIDLILQIAPRLAREQVRVAMWGGSEPDISQCRERLRADGVEDRLAQIIGFLSPKAFRAALETEASVGIVALNDNYYNRYLTCPAKALDYLSHGLPVVASDLPSTRGVLGPAAVYVQPGDAEGLYRAILHLLDDPEAYARAVEASRQRADELSWERRAGRLAEFVGAGAEAA